MRVKIDLINDISVCKCDSCGELITRDADFGLFGNGDYGEHHCGYCVERAERLAKRKAEGEAAREEMFAIMGNRVWKYGMGSVGDGRVDAELRKRGLL